VEKFEKNKIVFLIYILLTGKMFVGTTQVLFLTYKGFSFTEIMLISTIVGIGSLILEVPSGMVADRIGYRKCISIGLLLNVLGYVVILFSSRFVHIAIYSILISAGTAIVSGADYSLLYESFVILKQEEQFKGYIRKVNSIKMYVVAVLTIASGFLYNLNAYIPFLLTTILYMLALVCSFFFVDIMPSEETKVCLKEYFKYSFKTIKENKKFRWFIIEGSCFTVLFMNQNILLQQYMSDIGFKVSLFGVVFFFFNLVSAFVSKRSEFLENKFKENTKIVFTILIIVCFVIAGISANIFGIIILAFCRVSIATISPILDTQVNESIDTGNRATLLSVYNASNSIADSIISPLIGLGIDMCGIFNVYVALGILFILFVLFLCLGRIKRMY
jgi:MFS family permease